FRLVQAHLDCFAVSERTEQKAAEPEIQIDKLVRSDRQLYRKTHQTIQRVTDSIEANFHFNTAISGVMELVNQISSATGETATQPVDRNVLREALRTVLILLFPMVPHFSEELWRVTGHEQSLDRYPWPEFNPEAVKEDELTIVVQVNGKVRSRLQVAVDITEDTIKEKALADERIMKLIDGVDIKKIIVVKGKLVNIVV
ncbi:MAG: leucine--tRNA ligase, partial [Candidatus Electrothrix sp. AR4]|nr:leucine--tRNA ligase [Candidatus Electrothrix sp. AR4]